MGEGHAVLKLIAEAISARCLIESRAAPDPARQRLVEQPAIDQHIHFRIGRFYLQGAERFIPIVFDIRESGIEVRIAIFFEKRLRIVPVGPPTEQQDNLFFFAGREDDLGLLRAARIETGTGASGQRLFPQQCGRRMLGEVAPQKFPAVARPALLLALHVQKHDLIADISIG